VFEQRHADGRLRSGVLLSDGLLITAAEIESMEIVPELVFLNCCHLGQVDNGRSGNKLAASIARELIDIGVRCVIAAGWAVNDQSAKCFATAFYEQLLMQRRPFGDAVFEARNATWRASPNDITWGAFQAYGDPAWLAEPHAVDMGRRPAGNRFASPEELLDELANIRVGLSRLRGSTAASDNGAFAASVAALLEKQSPAAWRQMPQLRSELGMTFFELNDLESACAEFQAAIRSEDQAGTVPIRDIERLAQVETLLGEQRAEEQLAGYRGTAILVPPGEALIDQAVQRLVGLEALVGGASACAPATAAAAGAVNAERSELLGNAWRSKASLMALQLLGQALDPANQIRAREEMASYMANAVQAYQGAEGLPGSGQFAPTLALKRLALQALGGWDRDAPGREAALALARQSRESAAIAMAPIAGVLTQAEALLVELLIQGELGDQGDVGRLAFEQLAQEYSDATASIAFKPSELAGLIGELDLAARFCVAMSKDPSRGALMARTADRLRELIRRLDPAGAAATSKPRLP
jgi:hypothetical protein